eukprot:evm.model.scf_1739.1 EVM.evm.TU.scf_1739.1   scf_1739:6103-14239(+)
MNRQMGCPGWVGGALCPALSRLVKDPARALIATRAPGDSPLRLFSRHGPMKAGVVRGVANGDGSMEQKSLLERVLSWAGDWHWIRPGVLAVCFAAVCFQGMPFSMDSLAFQQHSECHSPSNVVGWLAFRGMPDLEETLREEGRQIGASIDSAVDTALSSRKGEEESEVYLDLIREVWEVVDANYMDVRNTGFDKEQWKRIRDEALAKKPTSRSSVYRVVREMLARGLRDPYTRLVLPADFDAMRKYDISGIGINVGTADELRQKTATSIPAGREGRGSGEGVWVLGLLKDSLGDAAGLRQGDEILKIDGASVASVTPFQAATMMKGDGSEDAPERLQLTVRRLDGDVADVYVPRPALSIPSPVTADLTTIGRRRVGFVELSSFNARAQQEMVSALARLEAQGATEIVLDLRNNRGGLVQEGVEVAKVFLEGDSPIVVTEEAGSAGRHAVLATGPAASRLPLTVLVNQNTASASEIVAGALKDNCRAVLAGSTTYGKGLIQSVYALSDGSGLVLTVGKYLTPGNVDIDREGIQPNFKRIPPLERAEDALRACRVNRR